MNVQRKLKIICVKKSQCGFEGAPFKPFEHTKTFFPQNVLIYF